MAEKLFHFYIPNVPNRMVGPLLAMLDEYRHEDFTYGRAERKKLPEFEASTEPEGKTAIIATAEEIASRPAGRETLTAIPPRQPQHTEKALPKPGARKLLETALSTVLPGEEVRRENLVRIVRDAGMTASAFDVHRQGLEQDGWFAKTAESGVYLRLQRPGEPAPATVKTPASSPSAGTASTPASSPSAGTASTPANSGLPDRIGGFQKVE